MRNLFLAGTVSILCALPLVAQQTATSAAPEQPDNAALMQKIRDLEDRVIALEGQLRTMKSQSSAVSQPPAANATAEPGAPAAAPTAQSQEPVQPIQSPTSTAAISEAGTQ